MEFVVTVKVLAFASYKEILGFDEIELPLPESQALGELLKNPRLAALPVNAMLAVNQRFVGAGEPLCHGDMVALMPPVSGG